MRRSLHGLMRFASLMMWLISAGPLSAQLNLHLGVFSYRPAAMVEAQFLPLAESMEEALRADWPDATIELVVLSGDQLLQAAVEGHVDLALLNPMDYLSLRESSILAQPIATLTRQGASGLFTSSLGGVILANAADSGINRLEDLVGMRVATPGPRFFGGYWVPLFELHERGLSAGDIQLEQYATHDDALDALLAGQVDAAFIRTGVIEQRQSAQVRQLGDFKVINHQDFPYYPFELSSRLFPEWPLVAMSTLDENQLRAVVRAAHSIKLGGESGAYTGFSLASDYRSVENLMRALQVAPFDFSLEVSNQQALRQLRGPLLLGATFLLLFVALTVVLTIQRFKLQSQQLALADSNLKLRLDEERFRSVFQNSALPMASFDQAGSFIRINPAFEQFLGYSESELIGKPYLSITLPLDVARSQDEFKRLVSGQISLLNLTKRYLNKAGQVRWGEVNAAMAPDPATGGKQFIATIIDVTERRKYQAVVERMANHDLLTDLPNRNSLSKQLEGCIRRADQLHSQVAVAYIDLDHFKKINDQWGHAAGDSVLVSVAYRLKAQLRPQDFLARVGGDEFVAILDSIESPEEVESIAERLLTSLDEPIEIAEGAVGISLSVGISLYPQLQPTGEEQLVHQADSAMYLAKLAGRNRFQIYDPERDQQLTKNFASVAKLRRALEQDEFELFYQPKVNMRTGEVEGAEALLRWNHPQYGLRRPASFIATLESDDQLDQAVGEWVLRNALQQSSDWSTRGLNCRLSVNVSAGMIEKKGFPQWLESVIADYPEVSPSMLQLELLETQATEDLETVSAVIGDCQKFGVSFALDDCGTGYSSLVYMKNLPAKTLKIDRGFVQNLERNPEDFAIVEGICQLAEVLGREVIAEGVETLAQGALLLDMGVFSAQGYVISEPLTAKDFEDWMGSWQIPEVWQGRKALPNRMHSLLSASVSHQSWLNAILSASEGSSASFPDLSIEHCRLGRWIETEAPNLGAESKLLEQLAPIHQRQHEVAQRLEQAVLAESEDEINELSAALKSEGERVRDLLGRIRAGL